MAKTPRVTTSPARKRTAKPVPKRRATAARTQTARSDTNLAIATELAPAVAIALLDKTEQSPGATPPALDVLAVGATASQVEGNVRMQLLFENGAVLPVEMSVDAGAALAEGLKDELKQR